MYFVLSCVHIGMCGNLLLKRGPARDDRRSSRPKSKNSCKFLTFECEYNKTYLGAKIELYRILMFLYHKSNVMNISKRERHFSKIIPITIENRKLPVGVTVLCKFRSDLRCVHRLITYVNTYDGKHGF